MLSFMKEQGPKESSRTGKASVVANKTSHEVPQGHQEQGYITVASKRDRARKSTLLLLVLVGIGLIFLFIMIKKSTPRAASAASSQEELQIEKAITQLTGVKSEMYDGMDEIVEKFYEFSEVEQVEVGELVKNPFRHKMLLMGLDTVPDTKDNSKDHAEIIYQQLRQQAEDMELLSIMQSSGKKCCMIDDMIVYEGDSIRSFKVGQIGDDFVKLVWGPGQGQQFSETEIQSMEIMLRLSD